MAKLWRRAAEEHGFELDEELGVPHIHGSVGGFRVEISKESAAINVVPRLDLFWGGNVRADYFNENWWPSRPRLDALLDDRTRKALDDLAELGAVSLGSNGLRVVFRGRLEELGAIKRLMPLLAEAVACLDSGRERVPVDAALARFEDYVVATAHELGFRVLRSPLGFSGVHAGVETCAWLWPDDGEEMTIELRPSGSERLTLRMTSRVPELLERLGITREGDPELGDKELDRRLTIETPDIDAVRARLGPPEREALRVLLGGSLLRVQDGSVRLRRVMLGQAAEMIAAAHRIVKAINVMKPSASPFR